MRRWQPKHSLILGFILVVLGAILPFLMVIKVLEANFFLIFLTFTFSVAGLFLGIIAAAYYSRHRF
jgi:hypothetical protein